MKILSQKNHKIMTETVLVVLVFITVIFAMSELFDVIIDQVKGV